MSFAVLRSALPVSAVKKIREIKLYAHGIVGYLQLLNNRGKKNGTDNGEIVLLLSYGGIRSSPILAKAASELGYRLHVISPEFPYYEAKYSVRWSKLDPHANLDRCLEIAKETNAVACLVEIRNRLLPIKAIIQNNIGHVEYSDQSARISNSKIELRRTIEQSGLPNARWIPLSEYHPSTFPTPFVFKPDTGSSSKGVMLVEKEADLEKAHKYLNSYGNDEAVGGEVLLEEYIDGPNMDVSGIYRDGVLYPLTVQWMNFSAVDGAFPASEYLHNPPIEETLRTTLIDAATEYVRALGITSGAFTCEMRIRKDGTPVITDYANRLSCIPLLSKASGLSLPEWYTRTMCERDFVPPTIERNTVYQRFVRNNIDLLKFEAFYKKYPECFLEFKKIPSDYAGVKTLSRLTVWAPNFKILHDRLIEFELVPSHWQNDKVLRPNIL